MRPSEGERLCQEAQVYYYDLLCQEEATVPTVVRRHVATCPACQEEMRRLREALFEAQHSPSAAGAWQDETIEALALQFQLLDERVTCSEAKPLLPELALASPRIRIPTPATVHVDHCPQCAADLEAIRDLRLTADQLKRLGRLLETERGAGLPGIEGMGEGLASAVPGSLADEDAGIACSDIAMADLFDRIVPNGATPPVGKAARERQKAIVRHVQSCPACLAKAQTLQRTIGEIMARANSEIVTVYHAENDTEEAFGEAEGGYPYPVSVQVLHSEPDAAVDAHVARTVPAAGPRRLRRSARPLATLAALVLVVIALASLLRTTASTASGINVGEVDKTLAKVTSVHIVVRNREAKPVQEFWIARRSNVLVEKKADDCVLYDLPHDRKTTIELRTGSRTSDRLSEVERDGARRFMAGCLRDLVTGISPDARLRPAEGETLSGAGTGLDVYELSLSPRSRNSPLRDRRLVYIDRATGLPQKMEFYRQEPGAGRGDPVTTTIFTYPTDQEMDIAMDAFLPA
jgi:Zn-finger nucleic acid-binding protein